MDQTTTIQILIMSSPVRRRFKINSKRSTRIIAFLLLSLSFATAIDGFSPIATPLRIQRATVPNENIIDKRRKGAFVPFEFRGSSTMPTPMARVTRLRGGFMLPFSDNPLLGSIGLYAFADFVVGFFISILTGSHVHLDLIGTGVFAVAALPFVGSSVAHIRWSSIAIVAWGTKLALFLFFRATQVKYDNRLTGMLTSTQGAFQFWFATFVWNVLVSLPFFLGLNSDRENTFALVTGGVLYLLGLTIESLADAQKYLFKQQQSSASQFCNVGLWKYSQHPNWFGNLLLWTGILVINLPALIEPLSTIVGTENEAGAGLLMRLWGFRKLILACLGPGFLWVLFNGQATGSVTNAVEAANARYGKNPDYAKYIKEVPLIIPKLKFW